VQIGFIGRLDYQKGLDLIQAALPELMQEDVQLVSLHFVFLFFVWLGYMVSENNHH